MDTSLPRPDTAIVSFHASLGPASVTLDGTGADDTLHGSELDDTIHGGAGNDRINGGGGKDWLYGDDGDDTVSGSGGGRIDGGAGQDTLFVNLGADSIRQGYTLDVEGGDGNDKIYLYLAGATSGRITAHGGAGQDVFQLRSLSAGAALVLTGFEAGAGGDIINLGTLAPHHTTSNPFAPGALLRAIQRGADTVLQYDADGYDPGPFVDVLVIENLDKNSLSAHNFWNGYNPDGSHRGMVSTGGAGNDELAGGYLDDTLDGGLGDDTLYTSSGNDLLIGGAGRDTVVYGNDAQFYTIARDAGDWRVSVGPNLDDGSDTLAGIERILFADRGFALDIDGVAGQAYRIYQAAFDRRPDSAGLGFWIHVMDEGVTLREVAAGFVRSEEFARLYGQAPGNAELVSKLYQNILHRAPEQAGYDFWLKVLDEKQADLPDVLAAFSDSRENQDGVAGTIGGGIFFEPYIG